MKKLMIRFFLTLCIFLLSGYSQFYAHAGQDHILHSSVTTLNGPAHASLGTAQDHQALALHFAASNTDSHKIVAEEITEEEHKSVSFKKYLESSSCITAVFYALTFAYFCHLIKKRLLSCEHSFDFASHKRYLLFRVLRI